MSYPRCDDCGEEMVGHRGELDKIIFVCHNCLKKKKMSETKKKEIKFRELISAMIKRINFNTVSDGLIEVFFPMPKDFRLLGGSTHAFNSRQYILIFGKDEELLNDNDLKGFKVLYEGKKSPPSKKVQETGLEGGFDG